MTCSPCQYVDKDLRVHTSSDDELFLLPEKFTFLHKRRAKNDCLGASTCQTEPFVLNLRKAIDWKLRREVFALRFDLWLFPYFSPLSDVGEYSSKSPSVSLNDPRGCIGHDGLILVAKNVTSPLNTKNKSLFSNSISIIFIVLSVRRVKRLCRMIRSISMRNVNST